jgi:hypothetical protein
MCAINDKFKGMSNEKTARLASAVADCASHDIPITVRLRNSFAGCRLRQPQPDGATSAAPYSQLKLFPTQDAVRWSRSNSAMSRRPIRR